MDWVTKGKASGNQLRGDVVLSLVNDDKKSPNIRFVKESWKKITKNDYFTFAIDGSRLYFKQEEPRYGFKLSGKENSLSKGTKLLPNKLKLTDLECGEYRLEWDRDLRLNYIDFKHKLDKLDWSHKY